MEKQFDYTEILENGTVINFNKKGLDIKFNGEIPSPFFENDDFTIFKIKVTKNNKIYEDMINKLGFIECIILYHNGIINLNHMLWSNVITTFDNMIYTRTIDERSYVFCTKNGVVQVIPDYENNPEQTLIDFGSTVNTEELNRLFKNNNYSIIEYNGTPFIHKKTVLE